MLIFLIQLPPIGTMLGWPKCFYNVENSIQFETSAGISFADVNGNNDLEVIFNLRYGDGDTLFVFDYQGNLLWKIRDSLIQYPAFADLDNDAVNEIIFGSAYGINVLRGDGTTMPPFPFLIPNCYWSEVSIADIDGDDSLDIIFSARIYDAAAYLYVLNKNGQPLQGWPRIMPDYVFTHPAVADIDNDTKKEIIYNTWRDSLYCFRYDGTIQPGFPVENKVTSDCGIGEVILCDIDYDGFIEIIFGSCTPWADTGCLYIYRWDGSNQPGWPKYFSDHIVFHPDQYHFAIGDINNDQKIEFVIVGTGRVMRILDQDGNYVPNTCQWFDWGAQNPLIANIDFTPEKEIIANTGNYRVSAFYYDGEMCYGWPIKSLGKQVNYFNEITVDDIDNDGLIELGLVIIGGDAPPRAYIHIWKLHGKPDEIEWGRSYYDLQRTCYFRR